jgi:hypothetical protein
MWTIPNKLLLWWIRFLPLIDPMAEGDKDKLYTESAYHAEDKI